jgi:phage shock protein A
MSPEGNNMNDIVPQNYKPKSFWERPEGVTGQIFGVSLIAGAGYVLYKALPYIITLLENTIYATVLGVIAVVLGFIVTDKRFWRLGKYLYMSLMRKITQIFVEIDPIGIMKNYVQELKDKLENMNKRIAQLSGMIRACKEEIAKNEKIKSGALKMVNEATKNGKATVVALQSRQAGRMAEANLTYQDLLGKLELLYRVLVKYQDVSSFLIQDMEQEIDIKTRKKQMADAAHSAMKSAMSIINGDPDAKEMFNLANEYLAADYAMKIGEIEDFVRLSDSFMSSVDLQNGVYESDALKMLEDWERNADSIVLGDSKRLLIENNATPASAGKSVGSGLTEPVRTGPSDVQWFDKVLK